MTEENDERSSQSGSGSMLTTRRALLAAAGGLAGLGTALGQSSGDQGSLTGGAMALNEAYNVSGELFIGPDSAKSNVSHNDGRVYMAADTQVEYYSDGGSWVKMGVGSDMEAVPAVHTEQQSHGATITDELEVKDVSPSVSDVGQAVIDAVDQLGTTGGVVRLPRGVISGSTAIDLSPTARNIDTGTPIVIQGHGVGIHQAGGTAGGSVLDFSGLADHAIKCESNNSNLYLRDFGIKLDDSTKAGVYVPSSNYLRDSRLTNIAVDGGAEYGLNVANCYGTVFDNVMATAVSKGHRLENCNAATIYSLSARKCTDNTAPSVQIDDCAGLEGGQIYSEGNQGRALSFTGYTRASAGWHLYAEQNNGSGQNDHEVVFGDSALASSSVSDISFNGMRFGSPANPFNQERLAVDVARGVGLSAIRGVPSLKVLSGGHGGRCVAERCQFNDVDTTNAAGTSGNTWTWIANNISGTINKNANDVTVSGD